MRVSGRCARAITGAAVYVALFPGDAVSQLRGDAAAVTAIERMIEGLGGHELWTQSRTLELDYRGWSKNVTGPVVERAWRDLTRPDQRIEIEHDGGAFAVVLTADEGWRIEGPSVSHFPWDDIARHRAFWPKDFYTVIRRLAAADPDLWVEQFEDDGRIVVFSESMGELGWWEIADDGSIERWGTMDMGEPLEYVYGPTRDFGAGLRLPAWGASLDAGWRFEYTRAALRASAIEPARLRPPG